VLQWLFGSGNERRDGYWHSDDNNLVRFFNNAARFLCCCGVVEVNQLFIVYFSVRIGKSARICSIFSVFMFMKLIAVCFCFAKVQKNAESDAL